MKTMTTFRMLVIFATFAFSSALAQSENKPMTKEPMKTFVIEREIPGAGDLTAEQLKSISQTSCTVLKEMGPGIEWLHSYVTESKIYCVYRAVNKEVLKVHGEKGGFPVNSISELSARISPATAD